MRRRPRHARLVLSILTIGFCVIVLLCWLDEYLGLTYRLFGGVQVPPNWREALFETGFAFTIWAITYAYISKLLARLSYLERFVRVCAWCRKINYEEEWISFEQFLELASETRTSHGVCPECETKWVSRSTRMRPPEETPGVSRT
jgi:hypothetical protein